MTNEFDDVFPIDDSQDDHDHLFDSDHDHQPQAQQPLSKTHKSTANARAMSILCRSDWQKSFLSHLAALGNVTEAARQVGISRSTPYKYAESHPEFKEAMDESQAMYDDWVLSMARKRIESGSDRILELELKARFPEKYREGANINVNIGAEIVVDLGDDDDIQPALVLLPAPEPPVLGN